MKLQQNTITFTMTKQLIKNKFTNKNKQHKPTQQTMKTITIKL